MGESYEDSQREVRDLFSKLSSWMEESQSQFSSLITYKNGIITKGVDNLVEEVRKLQDELSIVKKEKNILIETVNCLNSEIKKCNERTTEKNPDADQIEEIKPPEKQECISQIESELYTEKEHLCDEDIKDEDIARQLANPNDNTYKDYQNNLNGSSNNESKHIKEEATDCNDYSMASEESVCPECDFVFYTQENLEIHWQNVHSNLEQAFEIVKYTSNSGTTNNISRNKARNNRMTAHDGIRSNICEECGKAFSRRDQLEVHKASVHNLLQKCEKCPFKTVHKRNLRLHQANVHDMQMGMKKHLCDKCDFSAMDKTNMKIHRASVHKIDLGLKKLKCGKCPYETFIRGNLNDHIRSVHEKIRSHVCEKCGYSSALKQTLKIHRASAHNIDVGIKKRKCEKCSYETFKIGRLYQHIRSVHDKIRSHICEECHYASSTMANLKRHKRQVHKMLAPEINPT